MPDRDAAEPKRHYEDRTAALVGRRITGVRYWDLNSYGVPRTWDFGDWHHAVMGVDLMTDGGPFSVSSTSTFPLDGVEVSPGPIGYMSSDGPEGWAVETHPRWRRRIGTPIRAAVTHWDHVEVRGAEPAAFDVPCALRLDFDAGPVWIVTALPQWPDMEHILLGGDELVLVFTPERLRAIGLDPVPGNENSSVEIP